MYVVHRDKLDEFKRMHADVRRWIEIWLADVDLADWKTPQDIKDNYVSASFLADNVVIFNVRGNNYRLEVRVGYKTSTVVVQWIGTHAEYTARNTRR